MPIDPRIALGVQPLQLQQPDPNQGMNALARMMQIQGMQDERQMNRLKMDEYKRGLADQESLRNDLSAPDADPYNVLLRRGRVKEATDFQKAQADAEKNKIDAERLRVDTAHKRIDSWGQAMGFVRQNPTPENAVAAVRHLVTMGILPQEQAQAALAGVGNDPQSITRWATQGFQAALSAKDQLPKYETRNLGGTTQTTAIDPVTGQLRVVNSVANTATPGDLLADQRARQRLQQAEDHFQRGQDASRSKPFEVTGPDGQPVLVQQDKQGNITPVQGYSPKGQGSNNKPLSQAALKQITEARDNAETLDRLLTGFQEDFASKGVLGMGADASLAVKGVLGRDGDAVEWWKNYRKQAELVERHALFGAALTPGEQASWRSADIGPGMDPKVVKRNLQTRAILTKKVLETTRQDLIDAGQSEQRVNAIANRNATGTPAAPAAAQPKASGLTPEEQKELDALRQRFKK